MFVKYVRLLGFIEEGGRAERDPRVLDTLILNFSDGNLGGSCLDKITNLSMMKGPSLTFIEMKPL